MGFATYIARRSLAPGHFLDSEYSIELTLTDNLGEGSEGLKEVQESLSGQVETQFYGLNKEWEVELAPIARSEAALLIEFLDSVLDGQEFTFDPFGTESSPSSYATLVIRMDSSNKAAKFLSVEGLNDYVQYRFTVRES